MFWESHVCLHGQGIAPSHRLASNCSCDQIRTRILCSFVDVVVSLNLACTCVFVCVFNLSSPSSSSWSVSWDFIFNRDSIRWSLSPLNFFMQFSIFFCSIEFANFDVSGSTWHSSTGTGDQLSKHYTLICTWLLFRKIGSLERIRRGRDL